MALLTAREHRTDLAVAFALALTGQLELWWDGFVFGVDPGRHPMWLVALCQLGMTLPIALRRRMPVAALAAAMSSLAVEQVATAPADTVSSLVALLIMVASAAAFCDGRRLAAAAAITIAALAAMAIEIGGDALFAAVLFSMAAVAGRAVRTGAVRIGALERRATQLERERDERARAAALEERFRIARELHDLVAHHVSAIVLQAGAARQVAHADPDRAVDAMLVIEHAGREALDEMRHLLGILRSGEEPLERGPQPGLDRLGEIVERLRPAGIEVDLRIEGAPRPLPAAVDLSAFRIVQEALTNACKHSAPSRIDVRVRYLENAVEVEVVDDGAGDLAAPGSGNGLIGMRERVALFGGKLITGARPEGGYRVRARLPAGWA